MGNNGTLGRFVSCNASLGGTPRRRIPASLSIAALTELAQILENASPRVVVNAGHANPEGQARGGSVIRREVLHLIGAPRLQTPRLHNSMSSSSCDSESGATWKLPPPS